MSITVHSRFRIIHFQGQVYPDIEPWFWRLAFMKHKCSYNIGSMWEYSYTGNVVAMGF